MLGPSWTASASGPDPIIDRVWALCSGSDIAGSPSRNRSIESVLSFSKLSTSRNAGSIERMLQMASTMRMDPAYRHIDFDMASISTPNACHGPTLIRSPQTCLNRKQRAAQQSNSKPSSAETSPSRRERRETLTSVVAKPCPEDDSKDDPAQQHKPSKRPPTTVLSAWKSYSAWHAVVR